MILKTSWSTVVSGILWITCAARMCNFSISLNDGTQHVPHAAIQYVTLEIIPL